MDARTKREPYADWDAAIAAFRPFHQELQRCGQVITEALTPLARWRYTQAGSPYGPTDADMWRWLVDDSHSTPPASEA